MSCPFCGDICRCSSNGDSPVSPRWLPDLVEGEDDLRLASSAAQTAPETASESSTPANATSDQSPTSAHENSDAWRQELAARLNHYQARRKPRPPRYPSLRLRFEEEDSPRNANSSSDESPSFTPRTASHNALALDGFAEGVAYADAHPANEASFRAEPSSEQISVPAPATAKIAIGKILEFPRSWTPEPAPLDQLAEPVMDSPRILEAPEFAPPPPALGGITIEPAQQPALEKRPGIDIPLQSAPLARRIFSAAIDDLIIASASALFGFIFWKMTEIQPPRIQIAEFAAALSAVFWAAYQYLSWWSTRAQRRGCALRSSN